MKRFIIFIIIAAGTFLSAAIPQNYYSRFGAEYDTSGVLIKCKLKKVYQIENIPCRDWLRFYSDGSLKQCELAEKTELQGIAFPKYSILFFRENGSINNAWMGSDLEIDGIPCKGGWGKVDTKFYSSGKLKSCFLSENREIQEIPCKASLFHPVIFYENGKLKQATLCRDAEIHGILYEKGSTIAFENDNF
jgi:hypothetical protein